MFKKLYKFRFEIFLFVQLAILFGSLFFPPDLYENRLLPILYLLSNLSGTLIISKQKKLMWFFIILIVVSNLIFSTDLIYQINSNENILVRLTVYFVFHIIITLNIIKQVWKAKQVTKNVIAGLISGYICLGFLGFFLFMSIELVYTGAFSGILSETSNYVSISESLLYYSFITLLTIGYGDILPIIPIAQKASILVGLVGQFYLVIITAVVIEKYIRHSSKPRDYN